MTAPCGHQKFKQLISLLKRQPPALTVNNRSLLFDSIYKHSVSLHKFLLTPPQHRDAEATTTSGNRVGFRMLKGAMWSRPINKQKLCLRSLETLKMCPWWHGSWQQIFLQSKGGKWTTLGLRCIFEKKTCFPFILPRQPTHLLDFEVIPWVFGGESSNVNRRHCKQTFLVYKKNTQSAFHTVLGYP